MGRSTEPLNAAAANYVCVKVTDMRGVDLNLIRFDFDLTFAVLLMHPDGTVYHRYGSRGPAAAGGYQSLTSLTRLLRATWFEHRLYDRAPAPPATRPPQRPLDLPLLQQRLAQGQKIDCVHCHTIHDAEYAEARKQPDWHADKVYVYPDPERLGLTLDHDEQNVVTAVAAASPAATIGMRAGDVLLRLGQQASVRTLGDVQWALHGEPAGQIEVPVRYRRGGAEHTGELRLAAGWKRCDPRDYAWRAYKWNLSPAPGFGGRELDAKARAELGIAADKFALRVNYLVTWGERAHRGRAAAKAGLREGDVVLAFAGKDDFASMQHFHAWVTLTGRAGQEAEIVLLRAGRRLHLQYPLPR